MKLYDEQLRRNYGDSLYVNENVESKIRKNTVMHIFGNESEGYEVRAVKAGPVNTEVTPFYPSLCASNFRSALAKRVIHKFYKEEWADWDYLFDKSRGKFRWPKTFKQKDDIINKWLEEDGFAESEEYKLHRFICDHIIRNLEPLPYMPLDEGTFNAWLAEYDRPESRKQQIRDAYESLDLSSFDISRFTTNSVFLKNECYEEMKYPRCICPRDDKIVAFFGPFIHAIEEYVFHQSPLSCYFVKGYTPEEQIQQMARLFDEDGIFIETDYSSFEGSYRPVYQHLVEVTYFRHLLKNNPHVLRQLEHLYVETKLKSPFFSVRTRGSRMSGDLWTSLMNGLSNLSNMLYIMDKHGVVGKGLVEGDDGLFEVSSQKITPDDFTALGFSIKLQYEHRINHCAFCQKIFSPDTLHLLAPPELLNRIGWLDKKVYFRNEKKWKELLIAKAYSYFVLYPYSPIISVVMRKIIKEYAPQDYRKIIDKLLTKETFSGWYWRKNLLYVNVSVDNDVEIAYEDRLLYEELYGLTVQQQIEFEEQFDPRQDFSLTINMASYTEGVLDYATW